MTLEGLGTAAEPYLIRDAWDLGTVWFKPLAHYRLEASLDLSGTEWSAAIVPSFGGMFDGNGYVISNLQIQGGGDLGLFGQLDPGAYVSNLTLEAVDVSGTGDNIGVLSGYSRGSITSCYIFGSVEGNDGVGGLVGSNEGRITMSNSSAVVKGKENVGGLVGLNHSEINTSCSGGFVRGDVSVGGLVGTNHGAITTCYRSKFKTVRGAKNIGGLVGTNRGDITNSYSTGEVRGNRNVGGFAGTNYDSIIRCYSTGTVRGIATIVYNLGGFVGWKGPILGSGYTSGCYWDTETSGRSSSDGGSGRDTAEMKDVGNYRGWDFTGETENGTADIWWMPSGRSYPRLWWELDNS